METAQHVAELLTAICTSVFAGAAIYITFVEAGVLGWLWPR